MAKTTWEFKTGVLDFLGTNGGTATYNATESSPHDWTFVSRTGTAGAAYTYPTGETTYVNTRNAFLTTYASNPLLNNDQVKSIGFGWQKWVVPRNMTAEIVVRGGCGGHSAASTAVLNQSTGLYTSGNGLRGGRGAKLVGKLKLTKGEILYILVGLRGLCWLWGTIVGANGGGASCVLRENPQGNYTFNPTNKKVDVLFVAGGGGAAADSDPARLTNDLNALGKDASPNNGLTTNGGILTGTPLHQHTECPGAGLSGNAESYTNTVATHDKLKTYNLLSGTPSNTTSSRSSYGKSVLNPWATWGGGGGHLNGGGGGGGYSGGNVIGTFVTPGSLGFAGDGGTSYINPNYITEVFRGYETNVAMNPYSIPGSVVITGGRDTTETLIAVDSEGNKRWNNINKVWELHPTNPYGDIYPSTFLDAGNTETYDSFEGLIPGDVKFYCSSPNLNKYLMIDGLARYQVITSTTELNMSQIDQIKNWNVKGLHASANIKCAISTDGGLSYKILSNYNWISIDIRDRELFWSQGISLADLNTIPSEKWLEGRPLSFRFAFIINQNYLYEQPVLSGIEVVSDLVGAWRKAIHGSQYDYEYIASDLAKITFNQAGSYKVNYLDKVIESEQDT